MNASFFKSLFLCSVLSVGIALSAAPAQAGLIEAGTEQAHLDFANDPMFQSVGWVLGTQGGTEYIAGSAVLISPEWILTAAHVLDNGWDSVGFGLDPDANDLSAPVYAADAWYLYPGFVSDGGNGTNNDIALIHLSVPIVGVTPAIVYGGEVEVGTHAYWSGYGLRGYYPTGETNISGLKMGGENSVDSIGDTFLGVHDQFFMADWGPAHSTPTLPLEMGGTNGDSGGGWFADINGQTQLIGLAAFARGQFSNTGVIRPAVYHDWIQSYVTPVPEPSSIALMLSALPLAFRRLRRRVGINKESCV